MARNRDRLEALASELENLGASAEVLAADLFDSEQVAMVEERLRTGEFVDTVINNAGMGTSGPFVDLDLKREIHQIELNVLAVVRLSHEALGRMVAEGRGGLLNVSSTGGFMPGPTNATYSATKAFVTSFTEALHEEVRGSGVRVSCLCPGFTRTEFQERAGVTVRVPGLLWSDADAVADAGLKALEHNQAICVPSLPNKAAVGLAHLAPRGVVRTVTGAVIRRF